MNNVQELSDRLSKPNKMVIISHANPDGDAVGSSLALAYLLQNCGHKPTCMVPNTIPDYLSWLPGVEGIMIYEQSQSFCKMALQQADLIFCLDFSALDRIGELGQAVVEAKKDIVMVDHHLFPESFAKYTLHDTTASSTCELVFDFMELLGLREKADTKVYTCMYTGILTDTGGFKHALNPALFRKTAVIYESGFDYKMVHDLIFNSNTEKRLRILGYCLFNKMDVMPKLGTAIVSLSQEEHKRYHIAKGDLEGVVNYLLSMDNVNLAILITEQKEEVRLSMRSKGNFSVQELCSTHFSGGGHFNASGGTSKLSLEDTLAKLKRLLEGYKEGIIHAKSNPT